MARLTSKERRKLPKSTFAIPGAVKKGPKGGKKTAGGYPIPDVAHGRNALARVSQFGTSAEKATVRSKVKAKFPQIGTQKPAKKAAKKTVKKK